MEGKKPGEMVSVETDGEKATSITVSNMSAMGHFFRQIAMSDLLCSMI